MNQHEIEKQESDRKTKIVFYIIGFPLLAFMVYLFYLIVTF